MSTSIKGIITKILSYPSDTQPTVFKVKTADKTEEQRCQYKGFFPIKTNDIICAKGEIFLKTLIIKDKPLVVVPASSESLKSAFVKALKGTGFGPKKAETLHQELFERYSSNQGIIQRLNEWAMGSHKNEKGQKDSADFVEAINKKQLMKLLDWWYKNYNKRRLYLLGLNNQEINNAKMSENELYEQLTQHNALGVSSLSLEKAIQINNLLDKKTTANDLVAARVNRFVNQNCVKGMMATPLAQVLNMFTEAKDILPYISKNYNLVFEEELVYTKNAYQIEDYLCQKIKSLIMRNNDYILRFGDLPHVVNPIQVDDNIQLTEEQHKALEGALTYHISVITGGAGCGKTTLIKQLVKNLKYRKKDFLLTSFTGKAVLRIKETLGDDVQDCCFTLSRLIYKKKNYQHIPKFKYLIVDEASMVSSDLIYNFMKYFTHSYSIILIGDCNQLPPIGLGAFFSEIIKSEKVPIFRLTENKRIASSKGGLSNILINANRLIDKERNLKEPFVFRTSMGFEMIEGNLEKCKSYLGALYKKGVKKEKITVLTPFNKDISAINKHAQSIYSEDIGCEFMGIQYQIGDRVMQTINVYNENFEVMNGEEGYITEITPEYLRVQFTPSKVIDYTWKMASTEFVNEDEQNSEKEFLVSDLKHSFCKTVHKSQGSEYDFVILYVPSYHGGNDFININLLYTAITRTKKKIWVIGDLSTIESGCSKKLEIKFQKLASRLQHQ